MKPVNNGWHFRREENSINVNRVSSKYTSPLLRNPFLDICQHFAGYKVQCVWRIKAGLSKTWLKKKIKETCRDMRQAKRTWPWCSVHHLSILFSLQMSVIGVKYLNWALTHLEVSCLSVSHTRFRNRRLRGHHLWSTPCQCHRKSTTYHLFTRNAYRYLYYLVFAGIKASHLTIDPHQRPVIKI